MDKFISRYSTSSALPYVSSIIDQDEDEYDLDGGEMNYNGYAMGSRGGVMGVGEGGNSMVVPQFGIPRVADVSFFPFSFLDWMGWGG